MNNQNTVFQNNLIFLRKRNKMTQREVAEKISVDQTTIGRWEDGNREPTIGNVINLSKVFNISLSDLLAKDLPNSKDDDIALDYLLYDKIKTLTKEEKQTILKVINEMSMK